jgi:unsaturated rhamnogalacturonyl hydrolase
MYSKIDAYIEKLLSQSTPDAPIWNIESIRQGKAPHWNYIDGCMITSLLEIGRITNNPKYFDFAESFVDFYVFDDGSIRGYDIEKYNLDDLNEGRVLFELYEKTGKEKYRLAIEHQALQLNGQPRTCTGNFWHKLIYPNQIWLDGPYMAQVFSTKYQKYKGNKDYSDILMQIKNVRKYMFNENDGLYYHGLDCSKSIFWADKETGLSQHYWLRALGWYSMALLDTLYKCEPGEEYQAEYENLKAVYVDMMDSMLKFQHESGLWYQLPALGGKEPNYLETSGTAIMAYCLLKGVRLGFLPESYREYGLKAFNGVCDLRLKEKDGKLSLGGICLVAGLGPASDLRRDGSFEYYMSEPIVEDDAKGVGPLLLAYTELRRLAD